MSWKDCHAESEQLAAAAEIAIRHGDTDQAHSLYAAAAESEARGIELLDRTKQRTLGISAVSAVALWFKAQEYAKAEKLAYTCLSKKILPDFASEQLKTLLQELWNQSSRTQSVIRFAPGQVIVSITGGEIVRGGAPLDLVLETVKTVQSIFYRLAEYLNGMPLRIRGLPKPEISEMYRPWLFQTTPGSYKFAVAIQDPVQQDLFGQQGLPTKEVTNKFLTVLKATVDDPIGELPHVVRDREYRKTFLELIRNLAPTGKRFSQMEVSSVDKPHPITLTPSERDGISRILRTEFSKEKKASLREENLRGILRALHLDQDWLQLSIGNELVKIFEVGAAVDDVIGPMVNRPVLVEAMRDQNGRYLFRDIELDD